MKHSTTRDKGKKVLRALGITAFWLLVWQLAYLAVGQDILLVSPVRAFSRLLELSTTSLFWRSVGESCLRILAGYFLSVVVGVLLAVLTAWSKVLYHLLSPLLKIIRTTPVASFIILALVWFTTSRLPVFIAFLMVVPVVWANVYAGIRNTDQSLLEMARVFRFSRRKKTRYIYIPAVMPYFVAACSTGLGFAWKSGVAAEVIALPRYAVGRQINNAKVYLMAPDLFAWTIAIILLSVVIEAAALTLLKKLERRVLKLD